MYSYTHTQQGPSSHVHKFHPHGFTARPVARQITPPRSTVTTSRTVETIGGNRYRSRSYRMPASPPRSSKVPSAPSASRGRPRFALCRGSPPSPPPLEEGANGMSSLASLIEFPQPQVLSHVQVGGKKKKESTHFARVLVHHIQGRSDLIRYIVVVRSIYVRDQRGRPKLASIPGSGNECVHACPCDIQPQIEQETKKACQTDVFYSHLPPVRLQSAVKEMARHLRHIKGCTRQVQNDIDGSAFGPPPCAFVWDSPHETDQPELGPAIRVERLGRQDACDRMHSRW